MGQSVYNTGMGPQIIQAIEDIRKQFHKEWLLIAVDEMDEKMATPLKGRLLAHSHDPMAIHKVAMSSKERLLMTEYSDDWPDDSDWKDLSISSAMRGMEHESSPEYTTKDLKEKFQ